MSEIGSAFLCSHVGHAARTLENGAAYIASWLRLRDDRRLVLRAAQRAQRAVDFILGASTGPAPEDA